MLADCFSSNIITRGDCLSFASTSATDAGIIFAVAVIATAIFASIASKYL